VITSSTAHRDIPHSVTPIFYRLKIDRMTGHRATPDLAQLAVPGEEAKARDGWWAEILRHMGVKD
jgi:hypothetical protein